MKCEYGYCTNCEKEIVKKCSSCDSRKTPTNDYTEVELNWSNGSRMKVAVCIDCAQGPIWKADKQALTKAHWDKWDEMGGAYSREIVIV